MLLLLQVPPPPLLLQVLLALVLVTVLVLHTLLRGLGHLDSYRRRSLQMRLLLQLLHHSNVRSKLYLGSGGHRRERTQRDCRCERCWTNCLRKVRHRSCRSPELVHVGSVLRTEHGRWHHLLLRE